LSQEPEGHHAGGSNAAMFLVIFIVAAIVVAIALCLGINLTPDLGSPV